ncbi:laccase [Roridomyces roridus]|uniref:Laccase n=1 Tax=Roridomyces roridus TaxID=1738132 RepID=A0AAD7C0C2_9AGAR|nr:laccase [Roridomyces roridus]
MILSAAFYLLSALSGTYAVSIGPEGHLAIVNKHISPDGYTRSAVLPGGTFPGPLIRGNKGDRFSINVEDQLKDTSMEVDTSIHWHGIFQHGTNYEDGVAMVTQCPIIPGDSFKYEFDSGKQAGTYWYHSHLSTQYCDGLRGPLVIYDPNDPAKHLYDYDDESTVITLADWYHYPASQNDMTKAAAANSTLINGLGRYEGGPLTPLAVISVHHGKRYRFRLISMSCDPNFLFNIDGHSFTVIEADGVNTKPYTVDAIQIYAGQRYSFVLNANQPVSNYWIRAQPLEPGLNQGFVNATNSAILRYADAPKVDPKTNSSIKNPLVESSLHPLARMPVPGKPGRGNADLNVQLTINIDFTTFLWTLTGQSCTGSHCSSTPLAELNSTTYVSPPTPVLLQILNGARTAQELLPNNNLLQLEPNQVVEVSFVGGSIGAPHPFHLHGHNFWVVRSAGNDTYNYEDPIVRDVISTGDNTTDLPTIRFVTDNAGPWFLHCHIDWHLQSGLALVFAENVPGIGKEKPPVAWDNLCPTYQTSLNHTQAH